MARPVAAGIVDEAAADAELRHAARLATGSPAGARLRTALDELRRAWSQALAGRPALAPPLGWIHEYFARSG